MTKQLQEVQVGWEELLITERVLNRPAEWDSSLTGPRAEDEPDARAARRLLGEHTAGLELLIASPGISQV